MRNQIVAGNWKLNNTLDEGLKLTSEIVHMVNDEVQKDVKVILGTPFIHLASVHKLTSKEKNIGVAAQDCSTHESGAYTGEVSAAMVASTGAKYVIIGHSERRAYHNETNDMLETKVDLALKQNLTPIFCCGEPLEVREAGTHEAFVCQQLSESLFKLSADEISKLVIAYEPIWAIGTGKTASSQQAQDMHKAIRAHLAGSYGNEVANAISILYGGSCKPSNAHELFSQPDIDGGLIGGASLKSRDFVEIIKSF